MRILIFYASYGGGHLSAAKSIKQYLDENYKNVKTKMVDCVEYINKGLNTITTFAYKEMAKKAPWAWGEIYDHSQKGAMSHISSGANKFMSIKLNRLFEEFKPDVVISTHPFASQMTAYLKEKGKTNCILASVMTDFASHDQWLVGSEFIDHIFVSYEGMKKDIIAKGVPSTKIHATGIPLSNRFLEHFNKREIKASFDLDYDKKTILFFGGGEFGLGKEKTLKILKAFIDNIYDEYQIIAISGKNEKMQAKFEELVGNNPNVQVYGFTNEVPELMSISDLVVTKPGGLTITESLASGLPIVVINPIPGQEVENAEFLEKNGVAVWIRKTENPDEAVKELLENPEQIKHMKIRSKLMAKKNSTKDICKIIMNDKT